MKRLLPASSGIPPNGASGSAPSLQGKADRTAVDARVLADVSQGTHPREAVSAGSSNAPVARPNDSTLSGPS